MIVPGSTGPFQVVWILAGGVFAVMLTTLGYAFGTGDLSAEGAQLVAMPWGLTTLVEVYAGIALFAGWVAYRERSRATAALWVLLICAGGNIVSALYVLLAAHRARGDARTFWFGPGQEPVRSGAR